MKIFLFLLLTPLLLISCQPPADEQVSLNPKHWKLVNKKPPTYFPVDTPADQKTTHGNGYWVYSGDAQNTQYFIPFNQNNVPNKALLAEAQSTYSPKMKDELRRGNIADKTLAVSSAVAKISTRTLAGMVLFNTTIGKARPDSGRIRRKKKDTN